MKPLARKHAPPGTQSFPQHDIPGEIPISWGIHCFLKWRYKLSVLPDGLQHPPEATTEPRVFLRQMKSGLLLEHGLHSPIKFLFVECTRPDPPPSHTPRYTDYYCTKGLQKPRQGGELFHIEKHKGTAVRGSSESQGQDFNKHNPFLNSVAAPS